MLRFVHAGGGFSGSSSTNCNTNCSIIVGCIVGGIALCVVLCFTVAYCSRRRRVAAAEAAAAAQTLRLKQMDILESVKEVVSEQSIPNVEFTISPLAPEPYKKAISCSLENNNNNNNINNNVYRLEFFDCTAQGVEVCCVQSTHPAFSFEVTIDSIAFDTCVGLGFASPSYPYFRLPGTTL